MASSVYSLPMLLDETARRFPQRVAVSCGQASLTYELLARRSNSLASVLQAWGVRRGDRVGIYMRKSIETVIALYGIMQAGAAYVPIDPFAPVDRMLAIIRDCGICHLVADNWAYQHIPALLAAQTSLQGVVGIAPPADLDLLTITWEEVFQAFPSDPGEISLTEQDLAYILYTSGSTGIPKGIMHTHGSALSFVDWATETYALHEQDRVSSHAPFHFDLSIFDLFATAKVGAHLILIPENITKFPASLSRLIESEGLTIWYSVPFALIQLLLHGALQTKHISSLRWILFAGEVLPKKYLRPLMAITSHARYSNLYGPTETNVCLYYHVPADEDEEGSLSIGRACEQAELLVVDEAGCQVHAGTEGELLVCSPTTMRGYWNQPEMTQKAFFCPPPSHSSLNCFYRTGDMVKQCPDGNYEFLGRKDRQIKMRGYRIELDEIEAALLLHEQISEAAVYAVVEPHGVSKIEAAVIPLERARLDPSLVTQFLLQKLPSYAVPGRIISVQDFPRTSTGKIDRQAIQGMPTSPGDMP